MNIVHKSYDELFCLENIFEAWKKFRRGKTRKDDMMEFELHLEDNLFGLYEDLGKNTYKHSTYEYFQVFDNKKRDIHKAKVRDRVVHQIIYDYLIALYEPIFIVDSYASRENKGQYKAINAFRYFIKLVKQERGQCFVLKCDVRKYFDSIDQRVLLDLIRKRVDCEKTFAIIEEIIDSYCLADFRKGVPLGNITSQIFANIYLDVLDNFVKKELRCRFYVRYNDDFVFVSQSKEKLEKIRAEIRFFAKEQLLLNIPLEKTSIRNINWGMDFLGFVVLPKAVLLRNKTKEKMKANIGPHNLHSYLGILQRCNSYRLRQKIMAMENIFVAW